MATSSGSRMLRILSKKRAALVTDNQASPSGLPAFDDLHDTRRMQHSWRRACDIAVSLAALWFATGCGNGGKAGLVAPGPEDAKQLLLMVSNEASNDISFIDAASGNVLGAMPVGKRPRGLKVSPDGQRLYVALSGSPRGGPNVDESKLPPPDRNEDGIGVIDLESGAVHARLSSGNDPETVDASPDGRYLAVANEDSAQLSLIDASSGALVARVAVGVEPEGVRFSPDGRFVYVTSEANDRIDVVDVAAQRVLTSIPTGKRPRNVLFSPDGERAYVSCELAGRVDVLDARSHRALASISIEGDPKPLPMGLALDDSQGRLYVSLGRAGEVAVVDTGALRLIGRVSNVGARPWGIVLSPDAERLYTANGPSGDVSVIDTRSLQVVQRIPVGKQPWGLGTVRVRQTPSLHAGS
jgi:YVTN family beta-propeller protein